MLEVRSLKGEDVVITFLERFSMARTVYDEIVGAGLVSARWVMSAHGQGPALPLQKPFPSVQSKTALVKWSARYCARCISSKWLRNSNFGEQGSARYCVPVLAGEGYALILHKLGLIRVIMPASQDRRGTQRFDRHKKVLPLNPHSCS
jgi:hypothetical protein